MIYFLTPTDGGPVKIGFSNDVEARRRQLESHYGQPLVLLGTMPGDRPEEQAIHERFAHLRLGRTEQFRPEPELMAFIGRPLFASACPVVEAMEVRFEGRDDFVRIRMTADFKAWLERYADHRQLTITDTLIQAVIDDAARRGFEPPPKR